MAVAPPSLEAKIDNKKDRIEKIYTKKEKIIKFQNNACKAIAKIGKMYINTSQKIFFPVKTLSK